MSDFIERREYFRINVNCEINFRLQGDDKTYQAQCTTLSGAGVSFISCKQLKLNDELEILIESQLPTTLPLRGHVKVVNVRSLPEQLFMISARMTVLHDDSHLNP